MSDAKLDTKIAAARAKLSALEGERDGGPHATRHVSTRLAIGILLFPYIFAWFLLRQGYSTRDRIIGFGWMALMVVFIARMQDPETSLAKPSVITTLLRDPDADAKAAAGGMARMLVPKALKDPGSAMFGQVWGMNETTACGYVNAKNSFGAMTGEQAFIMTADGVQFQGGRGFMARWDKLCVETLTSTPPPGAMDLRWGAKPGATVRKYADPIDGVAIYVPTGPVALEGIPAKEGVLDFDRGRFVSAHYIFDGEANRDAVMTALVKRYGRPLEYDERLGFYKWEWPSARTTLRVDYAETLKSTTATFQREIR